MKKISFFTFIFFMFLTGVAFGMTPNEFMLEYPNDFIYRVDYPSGGSNYISSPVKLEFDVSNKTSDGTPLNFGKAFVIKNPNQATYYRLTSGGSVYSQNFNHFHITETSGSLIGFEGDIDIYRWNGSSFFLPLPYTFLRGLLGQIPMILLVGFGILSAMLLIRLLVVYFRRFWLR